MSDLCPSCQRSVEEHSGEELNRCIYESIPPGCPIVVLREGEAFTTTKTNIRGLWSSHFWSPADNWADAGPLLEWILKHEYMDSRLGWAPEEPLSEDGGKGFWINMEFFGYDPQHRSDAVLVADISIQHASAPTTISRAFLMTVGALLEKEKSDAG